jgi:hypothetical protein
MIDRQRATAARMKRAVTPACYGCGEEGHIRANCAQQCKYCRLSHAANMSCREAADIARGRDKGAPEKVGNSGEQKKQ